VKADLDLLIHRHLEGSLSEAEAADLGARLKADPDARRRLAEMAFDVAQLRDVLTARPAARRWKLAPVPLAAAALFFAAVVGLVLFSPGPAAPVAPVPSPAAPKAESMRGFAGPVRGIVAGLSEASFLLKVAEAAPHPLSGRTVSVAPGFARADGGGLLPHKVHQAFVRRLADRQELTIDLRHVSDDVFVIGELTKAQSDWAIRKGEPRKPRPEPPSAAEGLRKEKEGDRKAVDRPEGERKDGDKEN
jgi:hypothetical protein